MSIRYVKLTKCFKLTCFRCCLEKDGRISVYYMAAKFHPVSLIFFYQVSIFMGNWAHVQTYVNKTEAVPDLSEVSCYF